ncbi:MAG: molybdate ABC transporter substrate-binding protein [Marinomonas sp.]
MRVNAPSEGNNFFRKIKISLLLIVSLGVCILPSQALSYSLHLAVASNFISPIKKLAQDFEQETGHSITLSFGSSGKLFAQIQNHAPYDIFLSADESKPQALITKQLAVAGSLTIYAKGQLVLWSQAPIPTNDLKETLLNARRIAMANPRLAPYGKAAEESLRNLNLWNTIQHKLVLGENIGQTYQFTYSKNADMGFVALSQVLSGDSKEYVLELPKSLYKDINQAAVILSRTQKPVLAASFMAFLMRADNQAKIVESGYANSTTN